MAKTKRILNKTIEQKVIKFIEQNALITEGDKILIALSGGGDSVCALNFFYKFKEKYKIEIAAVHVNHNLRGKNSDEDEIFCKEVSEEFHIKFISKKVDVKNFAKEKKISIEEAARELRYKIFDETLNEISFNKIITAHNESDNAETVILNLTKGAGLKGISGIPIKRGKIIRPFLCLTKQEISDYLKQNEIEFRTDESNLNEDFERNYIRGKIIPALKKINPSLEDAILRSSEILKGANEFVNQNLKEIENKILICNFNSIEINLEEFQKLSDFICGEIIKFKFEEIFKVEFTFKDFQKIKSLAKKQTGTKENIRQKISAYKERNYILIINDEEINFNPVEINLPVENNSAEINFKQGKLVIKISDSSEKNILENFKKNKFQEENNFYEIISADELKEKLILRLWQNGDKFIPLGMKGVKKISDFLAENKIPNHLKKNQLILLNEDEIIWVPGLRISERYKITEKTKRTCELWLKLN